MLLLLLLSPPVRPFPPLVDVEGFGVFRVEAAAAADEEEGEAEEEEEDVELTPSSNRIRLE